MTASQAKSGEKTSFNITLIISFLLRCVCVSTLSIQFIVVMIIDFARWPDIWLILKQKLSTTTCTHNNTPFLHIISHTESVAPILVLLGWFLTYALYVSLRSRTPFQVRTFKHTHIEYNTCNLVNEALHIYIFYWWIMLIFSFSILFSFLFPFSFLLSRT